MLRCSIACGTHTHQACRELCRLQGVGHGLRTALGWVAVLGVLAAAATGITSRRGGGGPVVVREPTAAVARPASATVEKGTAFPVD